MYHLLANYASLNSASLTQLPGVNDGNFTQQNSSFIFTEPYDLMAIYASGATLAAAQINSATLNAINTFQSYPNNVALKPASNPNVFDLRRAPVTVPMNEQFQAQAANAAGGAEATLMLWWIKPKQGSPADYAIQPGTLTNPRTIAIFTATIVLTVGVWSPYVSISFTNPLRGGIYQVNGTNLVCSNGTAYRWNFPIMPLYMGRKLTPGGLCDATYGNVPLRFGADWMGGQGRFNYFEPPQIQVLANTTTGSTTYTGYMDLTYVGPSGSDTRV